MKKMFCILAVYVFVFGFCILPVNGQEIVPAISTERPSVGYSPDLVPVHSLQLENGIGLLFQEDRSVLDTPESLIRFGISKNLELRVLMSNANYKWPEAFGISALQSSDPSLSVKINTGGSFFLRPKAGILSVSLPMGGKTWTSGSYDPGLVFIWAQAIKKKYFLNEIAAATLTNYQGPRCVTWAPSLSGGRYLSDKVSTFIEYAPATLSDTTSLYIVDGGVTFAYRSLIQLDMRSGYQKDSSGYHALVSVGYTIRQDNFFTKLRHFSSH